MGSISFTMKTMYPVCFSVLELAGAEPTYCFYYDEDYYSMQMTYCENGCCRDRGDYDEICCFNW